LLGINNLILRLLFVLFLPYYHFIIYNFVFFVHFNFSFFSIHEIMYLCKCECRRRRRS